MDRRATTAAPRPAREDQLALPNPINDTNPPSNYLRSSSTADTRACSSSGRLARQWRRVCASRATFVSTPWPRTRRTRKPEARLCQRSAVAKRAGAVLVEGLGGCQNHMAAEASGLEVVRQRIWTPSSVCFTDREELGHRADGVRRRSHGLPSTLPMRLLAAPSDAQSCGAIASPGRCRGRRCQNHLPRRDSARPSPRWRRSGTDEQLHASLQGKRCKWPRSRVVGHPGRGGGRRRTVRLL